MSTDIPDLSGRTAVVTGASSGLGLVVSRALAERGARVVLAVRDPRKGEAARAGLSGETEVARLDLADLESVRAFATGADAVDLLVANAAGGGQTFARTVQGHEIQFGVNHLGHFALVAQLLPRVTSRVVTVSSNLYRMGAPRWDLGPEGYSGGRAYATSKLANVLFGIELERRLRASGSAVQSLLAHPGMARTAMHRRVEPAAARIVVRGVARVIGRAAEPAAVGILYAATAPDVAADRFWGPGSALTALLRPAAPTPTDFSSVALDRDLAARLWTLSEELTGVRAPV